jgi:hypothetical protein
VALTRVFASLLEKKIQNLKKENEKRKSNPKWDVSVPGYQTFWTNKLFTLKSEYQTLVQQYPKEDAQLKQLLQVLGDIEDGARHPSLCRGK